MSFTRSRRFQALGAWFLALSQMFVAAGCRQATGGGAGGSASTASAATAGGVNMGQVVYDLLHNQYTTAGETAKAAALEGRKNDFITAINRIMPADVGSNLFPTLKDLLVLVDDGAVEAAVVDVDAIILDLLSDKAALDGVVKLMGPGAASTTSSRASQRTRNVMLSRILAYPEVEQVTRAAMELVRDHDGVDAAGQPNGEKNCLAQIQGLLSRNLLAAQPAPGTGQAVGSALSKLSDALLADQPLKAFPNLGAPAWAVRLDLHGNPKVATDSMGRLFPPFVDADRNGAADVATTGEPIGSDSKIIDIPPFGSTGARDSYGRALAPGGGLLYVYFDAKRTLISEVLLLVGELLKKDLSGSACDVISGLADRVKHDNGTATTIDDYETLAPDSPLIDLTWGGMEVMKRTSLCDLLRGLAAVVKQDPKKFGDMLDALVVAAKKASAAASTVPATAGGGQALLNDLLPLVEDAMRPRGRTTSAMRALLQAFNSEQRRLHNLPPSFALMMKYSDYRTRQLADATHKSIMQRVLDMMDKSNGCTVLGASGSGNMADFYLDAMAGNARILGINISIGTINKLVDISFIRAILCSAIKDDDVRALKDFNDTGALEAMKPICAVFSQRGETTLLKNIMLGLQRHYDAAMRPTEPKAVAILESGAVEKLFEAIDSMTTVRVPNSTEVVADVLADVLQALVDSSTPVYDRYHHAHSSLLKALMAPMDEINRRCVAKNLKPQWDNLTGALGDVLLQTYVDDNGTPQTGDDVERWKWSAIKGSIGDLLAAMSDQIPTPIADKNAWCATQQADMEKLLTGADLVVVVDVLKEIGKSAQKAVMNRAISNLFTAQPNAREDAFGSILALLGDTLAKRPGTQSSAVDAQALADVLHFAGRELDPALRHVEGVVRLLREFVEADQGLLILRLARNAFDMGPNGTDEAPINTVTSVLDDVSRAGGGTGSMTSQSLTDALNKAHDFIQDAANGLPSFIARIKARQK